MKCAKMLVDTIKYGMQGRSFHPLNIAHEEKIFRLTQENQLSGTLIKPSPPSLLIRI